MRPNSKAVKTPDHIKEAKMILIGAIATMIYLYLLIQFVRPYAMNNLTPSTVFAVLILELTPIAVLVYYSTKNFVKSAALISETEMLRIFNRIKISLFLVILYVLLLDVNDWLPRMYVGISQEFVDLVNILAYTSLVVYFILIFQISKRVKNFCDTFGFKDGQ